MDRRQVLKRALLLGTCGLAAGHAAASAPSGGLGDHYATLLGSYGSDIGAHKALNAAFLSRFVAASGLKVVPTDAIDYDTCGPVRTITARRYFDTERAHIAINGRYVPASECMPLVFEEQLALLLSEVARLRPLSLLDACVYVRLEAYTLQTFVWATAVCRGAKVGRK